MREIRVVALVCIASIAVGTSMSLAHADGGAYIDLNRTHYLPGQIAEAETYVTVPENKQWLLDRGPFYAFLLTRRSWPAEGRPIPAGAIRIGTFDVEHDRGDTFELTARLAIPDVPGAFYSIAFCNDPCTVTGFREQITGYISIVQTEREATLLDEQRRLFGRIGSLRREVAKGEKQLAALQDEFDARERDRAFLANQVNRLNGALARARVSSRRSGGHPLAGWALAGLDAGLVVVVVMLALRRRRRSSVVPDTPEALVDAVRHGAKIG